MQHDQTQEKFYLSFRIGREIYALSVDNAREIVECSTLVRVPDMPPWIPGVVHLRGSTLPVIDLRARFGMGTTELTTDTCLIVTEAQVAGEFLLAGMLADAPKEVFEADERAIEPSPTLGAARAQHYVRGILERESELVVVLEAERVFRFSDLVPTYRALEERGLGRERLPTDGPEYEPSSCEAKEGGEPLTLPPCPAS
ncbi:MAG: chemotaxis protein CheW [Myxococcota bacterium]